MKRYGSAEYVLNLPFDYGFDMVLEAKEETEKDKLWQVWLSDNANSFHKTKPYKEYLAEYKKNKSRQISRVNEPSSDELFAMAEKIKHSG